MAHIDQRLPIRDVESTVTDYVPHAGATFVATDSGAVYDANGSSWEKADREFDTLTANTLGGSLDADGNDITNAGKVSATSASVDSIDINTEDAGLRYNNPDITPDTGGAVWKTSTPLLTQPDSADGDQMWLAYDNDGNEVMGSFGFHTHLNTQPDGTDGHWRIYTSSAPHGEGGSRRGRFSVRAGAERVRADWQRLSSWRTNTSDFNAFVAPDGESAALKFRGRTTSGLNNIIEFEDANNSAEWSIEHYPGGLRIRNRSTGDRLLQFRTDENWTRVGGDGIRLAGSPIFNLREVGANPTTGDLKSGEWAWTDDHDGSGTAAWLYRNDAGTLHYFEPTGTK